MKNAGFYLISLFVILLMLQSCNKEEPPADPFKPFIELIGHNPVWSQLGEPYEDEGAKAFDITADRDTIDITYRMEVTNNVNVDAIGDYKVRFNVSDEAGNKANEVVRVVYVNIF